MTRPNIESLGWKYSANCAEFTGNMVGNLANRSSKFVVDQVGFRESYEYSGQSIRSRHLSFVSYSQLCLYPGI
jgi:hypothetical protein